MHIQVETITPDRARELLGNNVANRNVSQRRVRLLADAIRRGEWVLTHQGVALAPDGTLLDGQHRLLAVIAAGRAVSMLVAYDVIPDAKAVMDTGKVRITADVLDMVGGYRNTRLIVSAARVRMTVELGGRHNVDAFTSPQVIAYLDSHPAIDATAARAGTTARYVPAVRKSSMNAALSMIVEAGASDGLDPFVHGLQTGANLEQGDPRLLLRNYGARHGSLAPVPGVALTIKVWNGYVSGRRRQLLIWKDGEAFPVVLTP